MSVFAPPTAPTAEVEPPPGPGRRPIRWRPFVTASIALVIAALVNADELARTAERQPFGWRRDALVEVTTAVQDVADRLGLDQVRHWTEEAFGREAASPSLPPTPPTSSPTTTATATATSVPPATVTTQSGAATSTPTTTTPERRQPTAADPLRLWIVGDSMMHVVGQSLVNVAGADEAVDPHLDYRVSTGLSRPDYFDWPARLAGILALDAPEALVVMFGANDAQGIITPTGAEKFGTDAWLAEYRARTAAAMDLLTADGHRIYWVGQPIARADGYSDRMAALDEIYRSEADVREDVTYIDSWSLFAVDGEYAAYLDLDGHSTLVRQSDGIHLSRAGGDLLARAIVDVIRADWFAGDR